MPKQQQVNEELTLKNPTFSEYAKKGIIVIPEEKAFPIKGLEWSRIYRESWRPDEDTLLNWDFLDGIGFGLVTGQPSNIIAIDIDHASEAEMERVIQLLGDTPCKKFGTKGVTLFYRYNGEKNCQWRKDDVIKVELLSSGKKTTIPPSKHRSADGHYVWLDEPLIDCYDRLPALPSNYKELLDSLFSIVRTVEKEYIRTDYDLKPSFNDAVEALNKCDPSNSDRDGYWIPISLAFKLEVGDAGYQAWDAWCSRGGKQYKQSQQRNVWRSLDSHSVSYGTLIHHAKQGGYVPPKREQATFTTTTSIDEWEKHSLEAKLEALEESSIPPEFYTNSPNHIKEVCDWITSTAMYPQPILTLGSVISFFGFMMGKDFEFNSLRTNLYVANIAYSADGKEHVNRCIRGLMTTADISDNISYGFTSDTSILNDLKKNDGRTYYLTDELQALLYSISKRHTNSAEGRAVSTLLQAYTGVEVRTVTKANIKESPTIIVKNPLVTICGYTTPHMFESCLGTTEVLSGFVGRLSTFKGNKYIPEENPNFYGNAWKNIPANIVEIVKNIQSNRYKEILPDGTFQYGMKEIPTKCLELIKEYREQIRLKRNEMRANSDPLEVIFGRAGEVMTKYAMIASQGREITEDHINWAISVVEYNLSIICDVAKQFADTGFERKKLHALQYIERRNGQVTKSEFTKGCAIFDNARERNEVIRDLIEGGQLEDIQIEGSHKKKAGYRLIKG
jgi:hypothetical protein